MSSKTVNVKRLYWMRIPVADYLEDTAHLSKLEWYAYTKLVMHYWRRGGLPANDKQLAQILGLTADEWEAASPALREMFGRNWKHPDLDRQLAEASEMYERKAENARRSAEKREASRKAHAERDAERTQSQSQSQPQPQLQTSSEESPYQEDTKPQRGTPTRDTASLPANVHRLPKTGGAA